MKKLLLGAAIVACVIGAIRLISEFAYEPAPGDDWEPMDPHEWDAPYGFDDSRRH